MGYFKRLINNTNDDNDFSYSSKWIKSATNQELSTEREKVRKAYCSAGSDLNRATRLQILLYAFDEEMSKRAWGNEKPHAPCRSREHGWYLPNDDDD